MIRDHKRLTARFFQSVNDPDLFKEFFGRYKAWDLLNLKKKPRNDDIFSAWLMLEHPKREDMADALCCMNDIAREEGLEWLTLIAENVGLENRENLTLPKIAMRLWLYHRKHFNLAYEYFLLEKLDNLKVLVGREPVPCGPSESDLNRFRQALRKVLRRDGEGPRLRTDVGPHPEGKWVIVVPHENYVKPDREFKTENQIITRDRRPIYELVVIYYPEKGIIKLKAGRGKKKAEAIANAFAAEILKKKVDHFQVVEIVKFDPLFRPNFNFPRRLDDQFEWARPTELKFSPLNDETFTDTLHCNDTLGGTQSVLDQLKRLGFTPNQIKVHSLSIQFQFPGGGKKKRRTVILKPPNNYTLDETARDRYLETVLIRWGFIDVGAKINAEHAKAAR